MVRVRSDAEQFLSEHELSLKHEYEVPPELNMPGRTMLLTLPEGTTVEEAMVELAQDERVATLTPNDLFQVELPQPKLGQTEVVEPVKKERREYQRASLFCSVPNRSASNDPDQLWGMDACNAKEAWQVSTGSRQGPIVAVIDTGVDYNHPDLRNNIWTNPGEIPGDGIDNDGNGVVDDVHGYNAVEDSGDPMDDNGHGSHVAGTIGAVGNNRRGVVGMNWRAQIMPIKFLSNSGFGTADSSLKAVLYANKMGARIVNNSWAVGVSNPLLEEAITGSSALHVCAAGNSGTDNDLSPIFPAAYAADNVLSVASHDESLRLASNSNYGVESVDIAAPGVEIRSTYLKGEYITYSGTSMASPHVAGAATLIAEAYPRASNQEIKDRIMASSIPLAADEAARVRTGGRLNAGSALESDEISPDPSALTANLEVENLIAAQWTPTGDDGTAGQAAGYRLKVEQGGRAAHCANFSGLHHRHAGAVGSFGSGTSD